MKKVQVLMSTYNGEKYIKEQLMSILSQKNLLVDCLIRDDGSNDGTVNIINSFMNEYKNITLIEGINIGYMASFLSLVKLSGDYEYYAFADQDDLWYEDKLERAVGQIDRSKYDGCIMYCSNAKIVDENLVYINNFHSASYIPNYIYESKILNSGALGCSIVINKKLRDMLMLWKSLRNYPHDYLLTTICLYIGKVIYDKTPSLLYRQHRYNTSGGKVGLKNKIRLLQKSLEYRLSNSYSTLALNIIDNYKNSINEVDLCELNLMSSYKNSASKKMQLIFSGIRKKSMLKTFIFYLLIFSNKA